MRPTTLTGTHVGIFMTNAMEKKIIIILIVLVRKVWFPSQYTYYIGSNIDILIMYFICYHRHTYEKLISQLKKKKNY